MKIGILGPSKIREQEKIAEIARIIAKSGHQIAVTPDKGSSSEYFAQRCCWQAGYKIYLSL